MKKKILSLLLAVVMALSLVPTSVLAAPDDLGQAHVIVENTTYPKDKGAPWDGTLVDSWVKLTGDSTMMGCVFEALDAKGYTHTGTTYISEINGLSELDGGSASDSLGFYTAVGIGSEINKAVAAVSPVNVVVVIEYVRIDKHGIALVCNRKLKLAERIFANGDILQVLLISLLCVLRYSSNDI